MTKRFLLLFAILTLPMFAFGEETLTLDGAIAESMNYIAKKLPTNAKVAVLKVEAANDELKDYITVECENYIKDGTSLALANKKVLPDILKRNNIADINKVDEFEILQVARQLGAKGVVFVEFGKHGENYSFFVRLFDSETAKILGMQSLQVELDGILATLTGEKYLTPEQKELAKVKKELEELKAKTQDGGAGANTVPSNVATTSNVGTNSTGNPNVKTINGIECDFAENANSPTKNQKQNSPVISLDKREINVSAAGVKSMNIEVFSLNGRKLSTKNVLGDKAVFMLPESAKNSVIVKINADGKFFVQKVAVK